MDKAVANMAMSNFKSSDTCTLHSGDSERGMFSVANTQNRKRISSPLGKDQWSVVTSRK